MPIKLSEALREMLISAFPNRDLEIFVADVFSEPVNNIINSTNVIGIQAFDLIKWAESEGELGNLIKEATYRKLSKFQKFILDYLGEILAVLGQEQGQDEFSGKDLKSLAELIQQFKVVRLAVEACIKNLPDSASQAFGEVIKYLNSDKKPDAYKLYILFTLLYSYPEKEGTLRIFYFIETLSKQEEIQSDLRNQLRQFLPPDLFPPVIEPNLTLVDKIKEIISLGPKKKIVLSNGYLRIKLKKIDEVNLRLTCFLQYGDDPDDLHTVDLEDSLKEKSQRGTSCNYKNLAQTVSKLINLGENKFHTNQGNAAGSLILEFFLPCDYLLAETIDLWKIELIPGDAVSIGSRYGIILRSSDRMNNPNLLSGLKKTWERLENLLGQQPKRKITPKKWREQFFHLEKLDGLKEDKSKLEQKIGIKLTCGLPDDKAIQEQLVKEIILTDLPFVIWNRSKTLASAHDLSKEMDRFLKIEHFQDRMKLLDCVQKERARFAGSDNPENYLGHHLAFLYDDPYRPLPQLQLFSTE